MKTAMPRSRLALVGIAAVTAILSPASLLGQTFASGSLDLNSLSVSVPDPFSISWSGSWTLNTLNSVFSTDGGVGVNFDTGTSSASSSASVLYASAHSSAAAPGATPSGLSGHVDGNVTLPGGFDQLATVGDSGNFASLQTTFTLVGGPAMVTFDAAITSILNAKADPTGAVLHSDTIFNVVVDGTPVITFSDLITAQPGEFKNSLQNPSFNQSVSLDAGQHNLFIELDTEQQALTAPDWTGTGRILSVMFVAMLLTRRSLSGQTTN
jgi:hypothetical protein